MIFRLGDYWRFHLGNNMGSFFPSRGTRSPVWPSPGVPLMYHGVCISNSGDASTRNEILAHYRQISTESAHGSVIVTFDDGYASSIPAIRDLCALNAEVIWFVTTWFRQGDYLPKDWLRIVAERLDTGQMLGLAGIRLRLRNSNSDFRRWAAFRLNRALMSVVDGLSGYLRAMEQFYIKYRSLIEEKRDGHLLLASSRSIKSLLEECPSLKLGAHGFAHFRWDRLAAFGEIQTEVVESKHSLESLFSRTVDAVAYPYGFLPGEDCLRIVRHHYSAAYMASPERNSTPYTLPRYGMDGILLKQANRRPQ